MTVLTMATFEETEELSTSLSLKKSLNLTFLGLDCSSPSILPNRVVQGVFFCYATSLLQPLAAMVFDCSNLLPNLLPTRLSEQQVQGYFCLPPDCCCNGLLFAPTSCSEVQGDFDEEGA